MKKLLVILLAVLILCSLAGCGQKKTEQTMTGSWELTDSAELTSEARESFDKAMEGFVGVNYEPIAFLGSQIVSGTNRSFLCEATVVYPNAKPYYAVVTVYTDLQGKSSILNIVALNLGEILESGEIVNGDTADTQMLGSWKIDRESSVNAENAVMHLASQVVSGKNHCVLCKGWVLTFIYENTEGKTEVLKSVPLDIAALSQPKEA